MAGSKAKKVGACPNCESQGINNSSAYEISFKGNHGETYVLETHCNGCGWSVGAEGEIRNPGRNYSLAGIERMG